MNMFGRLSEIKKQNAVKLMIGTTEDISKTLIIWATDPEQFKTPKKPFNTIAIFFVRHLPYFFWL